MGLAFLGLVRGRDIIKSASVCFTANGLNLNLKSFVSGQVNSCQTTSMHGCNDKTMKSVTLTHPAVKWFSPAASRAQVKVTVHIKLYAVHISINYIIHSLLQTLTFKQVTTRGCS